MALVVQKFGGTSLGSPERIRHVADRIQKTHQQGHQLVVVVSAMGHTTDELIELAQRVSKDPPHREMDMLLTAGERISMALLCMALADRKVPALSLTGSQTGIITTSSHRRARIQRITGNRVRSAIADGNVVIVAGFQGVSETKEITTLGRGGSDTTAVALAAALQASLCEIFTDVDGVYSADPRIVSNAKLWKSISHEWMMEMAIRGAGVLHPRSVALAKRFNVPLCVRNSLNEQEGTVVKASEKTNASQKKSEKETQKVNAELMEDFVVAGVTAAKDQFLVQVHLNRMGVLSALWDKAKSLNLAVIAPVFFETEIRFFSDRDGEKEWHRALDELQIQGFVKSYSLNPTVVPLSIIGDRFLQDSSVLQEMIEVLTQENIPIIFGTASAFAVTVGISQHQVDSGVQALHRHFIEKECT